MNGFIYSVIVILLVFTASIAYLIVRRRIAGQKVRVAELKPERSIIGL